MANLTLNQMIDLAKRIKLATRSIQVETGLELGTNIYDMGIDGRQYAAQRNARYFGGGMYRFVMGYAPNLVIKLPKNIGGAEQQAKEQILLTMTGRLPVNRFSHVEMVDGMRGIVLEECQSVGDNNKEPEVRDILQPIADALGIRDWLQTGYSPLQGRWVLTDIVM